MTFNFSVRSRFSPRHFFSIASFGNAATVFQVVAHAAHLSVTWAAAIACACLLVWPVSAATLPSNFAEAQVASGLSNPTAMAFAPDGRLFVCQQGGQLRVIKNGSLLATPFVSLTVDANGERGMLGVAFDPSFATNSFVYVYYTATTPQIHNRVSRFTASAGNPDVAAAGSEVTILDLNNLSGATNHNGGAIHFGPDGKLYIAVGENANPANSQSVGNLLGKILRINSDGTLPADNPTTFPGITGSPSGQNRAIWSDGTVRWLSGAGRIHLDERGAPVRGVGVSMDVTERRMLEDQYQQAQKMEAIGRLAGGVAHDFNNLLTVILGYCEVCLTDMEAEHVCRQDIVQIQKAGLRAAGLTRQLLAFSRKQILEPKLLDLNAIVAGVRPMLGRLIGEDVTIVVVPAPTIAPVNADAGQLEQVVLNLAVNARDAMPKGGTLTIEIAFAERTTPAR